MIWQNTWQALSARIAAFVQGCLVFYESAKSVSPMGDYSGNMSSYLLPSAESSVEELRLLRDTSRESMPPRAIAALDRFFATWDARHRASGGGFPRLQVFVAALSAIRCELDYLLVDHEASGCNLVERAFTHLQRLIVADTTVAQSWSRAFDAGEMACEKLGAVHLLHHGVWAFKASAEGERTDLVMGTRLEVTPDVRRVVEVLALSEWKLVHAAKEVVPTADQGLRQARRYCGGILAGFELSYTRYIVLVSQKTIERPAAVVDGNITYRFITIAVDPEPPSRTFS